MAEQQQGADLGEKHTDARPDGQRTEGQEGNAGSNTAAMQSGNRRPRGRGGYQVPGYGMGHAGMPNMRGFMAGGFRGGRGGPRMNMGGMYPPGGMHPQQGMHAPHQHLQHQHQQQQQQQQPQEVSTTNVYLKGLRADTTDQFLRDLCKSYGAIKSAKAIIDRATQQCRGYGFVMFEAPESAQAALVGLQAGGYQADLAKVTNNERAHRPEQDLTNLYFSNLPATFSEENLQGLLQPYGEVGSCRILRDYYTGVSRGVGFARMASTALCERIIQDLNGKLLEGATEPVQCKFADNPRNKTKQFANRGGFNGMRPNMAQYNMMYPGIMPPMGFPDGSQGPRGNRMPGGLNPAQMTAPFSSSYPGAMGGPMFMAQPPFVQGAVPQFPGVGDNTEGYDRNDEFNMGYPAQ